MDLTLSRRLERAEATIGASFIAARQQLSPEFGAIAREFDGTLAIFDGADSPLSQTFGLGMFGVPTPETLSEIETFFESRGSDVMHEVSPLAGIETLGLLVDRGYRPFELSTVLVQGLVDPPGLPSSPELRVRPIEAADRDTWIEASVTGWSQDPEFAQVMRSMSEIACANRAMVHYVVERDGTAIATGSMGIHGDVALFAGASTIPSGRGIGAQSLLLATRLTDARRRGCAIAMMVTAPGSTSQRNAERNGFRVAYTRTKWRRARRA